MTPKLHRLASAFFLGVFVAPILSIVWFLTPSLRYFPIGDDSPHGVGLPVGFCIGVGLTLWPNHREWHWSRWATRVGVALFVVSLALAVATFLRGQRTTGWGGFGWLVGSVMCLHAVVSFLGLTLAGLFARRAERK